MNRISFGQKGPGGGGGQGFVPLPGPFLTTQWGGGWRVRSLQLWKKSARWSLSPSNDHLKGTCTRAGNQAVGWQPALGSDFLKTLPSAPCLSLRSPAVQGADVVPRDRGDGGEPLPQRGGLHCLHGLASGIVISRDIINENWKFNSENIINWIDNQIKIHSIFLNHDLI